MPVPVHAGSGSGRFLVYTGSPPSPKTADGFRFTVRFTGSMLLVKLIIATTDLKQISPSDRALEEQTETRLK